MEIGTKIRKIRELKGLSQENVAEELGMSATGYGKIERNEVSVNIDRLMEISKVFGVEIEQIIGFDDTIAFNNFNNKVEWQVAHYSMPVEMKKLYDDKVTLLEDKIEYLMKELERYKKQGGKKGLSDDELVEKYGDNPVEASLEKLITLNKENKRKRKNL